MNKGWDGRFGTKYLGRNPQTGAEQDALCLEIYGVTFTSMIERFLKLPRDISILEVGCGAGCNLELLRDAGFTDLRGIDINYEAASVARSKGFLCHTADITKHTWYVNKRFDLVCTMGALMHLQAYRKAMKEMARIGNYIWGLESYAIKRERVPYEVGYWRDNYCQKWIDMGFELVSRHAYPYVADKRNPRVEEMYLLKSKEAK